VQLDQEIVFPQYRFQDRPIFLSVFPEKLPNDKSQITSERQIRFSKFITSIFTWQRQSLANTSHTCFYHLVTIKK